MGLDETQFCKSSFYPQEVVFFFSKAVFWSLSAAGDTDLPKSPRGIRGFQLNSGHFGVWKVQGKVGGYKKWAFKRFFKIFFLILTDPFLVTLTKLEVLYLILLCSCSIIHLLWAGVLNEGGLFGERQGWHLPSYPTSSWVSRSLSEGLPNSIVGVGFFVTTFKLDIPHGLDVMMSFTFQEPLGQPYRAFLFVNGWMMGKRVGNLGLV